MHEWRAFDKGPKHVQLRLGSAGMRKMLLLMPAMVPAIADFPSEMLSHAPARDKCKGNPKQLY